MVISFSILEFLDFEVVAKDCEANSVNTMYIFHIYNVCMIYICTYITYVFNL